MHSWLSFFGVPHVGLGHLQDSWWSVWGISIHNRTHPTLNNTSQAERSSSPLLGDRGEASTHIRLWVWRGHTLPACSGVLRHGVTSHAFSLLLRWIVLNETQVLRRGEGEQGQFMNQRAGINSIPHRIQEWGKTWNNCRAFCPCQVTGKGMPMIFILFYFIYWYYIPILWYIKTIVYSYCWVMHIWPNLCITDLFLDICISVNNCNSGCLSGFSKNVE